MQYTAIDTTECEDEDSLAQCAVINAQANTTVLQCTSLYDAIATICRDAKAMESLHRAAELVGRWNRGAQAAIDVVADVLADLCISDAEQPDVDVSMEKIMRKVAAAARKEVRRARHLAPLEEAPEEAVPAIDLELDTDAFVALLSQRAQGDAAVLQLLGLYQSGVTRRKDVLATGMTPGHLRGASARLLELAREVRAEIERDP